MALGDSKAEYALAYCYEQGIGKKKSLEKALELLMRACKKGMSQAAFDLGQLYFIGEGVERSNIKALEYFRIAAERGIEVAKERIKDIEMKRNLPKPLLEDDNLDWENQRRAS